MNTTAARNKRFKKSLAKKRWTSDCEAQNILDNLFKNRKIDG